jgi:protein SCO1
MAFCRTRKIRVALTLLLFLVVFARNPGNARADSNLPEILESARFEQRLGQQVPLDLRFVDETGHEVRLGDYFKDKPVILTLNYYDCHNLCPLVLDGLVKGLLGVPFAMGEDFDIVTVSIAPDETPEMAAMTKRQLARRYARGGAEEGWHLLTGEQPQIDQLAAAVGVNYAYDEATRQYAHPSGAIIVTPEGKVARYAYGIEFSPLDLRLSLVEAAEHKIGSPVDQVLLFCYKYDPVVGRYTAVAMNTMRLGGVATVLMLGFFLVGMIRWERRHSHMDGRTPE